LVALLFALVILHHPVFTNQNKQNFPTGLEDPHLPLVPHPFWLIPRDFANSDSASGEAMAS
jgi:hypothetical protein